MTISNFEMAFYTISFLVPGFVMNSVISAFQPQKELKEKITFLRYLTLSSINYALWSYLIYIISQKEFSDQSPKLTAFIWFAIIFISPVIVGAFIGIIKRKEWMRKLLQKTGINTVHPIPVAWDYIFSKTEQPVWLLVTLKDNNLIGGYFGDKSFAGNNIDGKDVYIQEVYKVSDGQWQKVEQSGGMWIAADKIKHIEFRNN